MTIQPEPWETGEQRNADGQLENGFRTLTGHEWKCARCTEAGRLRVFSAEAFAGALYVLDAPQPGFDSGRMQLMCSKCRGEWLMWAARMGNDLHTHPAAADCPPGCLMRQGGRRLQHQNLMSATRDRKQMFLMCKAIDEQPNLNGTFLIVAQRAGYFAGGCYMRQAYTSRSAARTTSSGAWPQHAD